MLFILAQCLGFLSGMTKVLSPFHPGPVMITVSTDLPDLFGRLRIRFNTSRPDVKCACIINTYNITACMCNSFYNVQGLFLKYWLAEIGTSVIMCN